MPRNIPKDRTRPNPIPRWALLAAFVLVGGILSGCKYDDPGEEGSRPQQNSEWVIQDHMGEALPEELLCNTPRRIHLSLSRIVPACEGFNFSALRQEAINLVTARAAQLSCPGGTGCPTQQTYYTHWSWSCSGTLATVNVKAKVRCVQGNPALPPNVGNGANLNANSAATTTAPGENDRFDPPPGDGERMNIVYHAPATYPTVPCPNRLFLTLTYRERTVNQMAPENMGGFMTYQPFVDRAKSRARLLHARFQCTTPCNKQPFRTSFVSWGFDQAAGEVVVTVIFEVECKRP